MRIVRPPARGSSDERSHVIALNEHMRRLGGWLHPSAGPIRMGTAARFDLSATSRADRVAATAALWTWAERASAALDTVVPSARAVCNASDHALRAAAEVERGLGITRSGIIRGYNERGTVLAEEQPRIDLYRSVAAWIVEAHTFWNAELGACAAPTKARHPWKLWDAYAGEHHRYLLVPRHEPERERARLQALEALEQPTRMLACHRALRGAHAALAIWLNDEPVVFPQRWLGSRRSRPQNWRDEVRIEAIDHAAVATSAAIAAWGGVALPHAEIVVWLNEHRDVCLAVRDHHARFALASVLRQFVGVGSDRTIRTALARPGGNYKTHARG